MKRKTKIRATYLSIAITLASNCFATTPSEPRQWTSNKGTTLTAKIINIADSKVILKTAAGKEISVTITSLSQADQDFIKSLKEPKIAPEDPAVEKPKSEDLTDEDTKSDKDEATTVPTINLLPSLTEGEARGMHAFYKGDKYTASINRKGTMIVYYVDEENNIKPDWKITVNTQSFLRINDEITKFHPTKITKHGDPKLNPKEVKLTFLKETGIITEATIQFSPKGFTTWFRSETTPKTPAAAEHMTFHHFSPTNHYPEEDLIPEKMKIKMENMRAQVEKYNFDETELIRGNMDNFEIKGPLLGKGKIIVERSKNEESVLVLNPLPECALKRGFSIYNFKEDHTSKNHRNEKITFTFK